VARGKLFLKEGFGKHHTQTNVQRDMLIMKGMAELNEFRVESPLRKLMITITVIKN
jgi:hypothetical protein